MTKIQMIQTIGVSGMRNMILFLALGNLLFEFVSNFDIRISNFANGICLNHALWAYPKAGRSGLGYLLIVLACRLSNSPLLYMVFLNIVARYIEYVQQRSASGLSCR